jgi:hypothetical protein
MKCSSPVSFEKKTIFGLPGCEYNEGYRAAADQLSSTRKQSVRALCSLLPAATKQECEFMSSLISVIS